MSKETKTTSSDVGFIGLLTIVFITLKLLGYINWSWWWALSPMWISTLMGLVIIGVIVIIDR